MKKTGKTLNALKEAVRQAANGRRVLFYVKSFKEVLDTVALIEDKHFLDVRPFITGTQVSSSGDGHTSARIMTARDRVSIVPSGMRSAEDIRKGAPPGVYVVIDHAIYDMYRRERFQLIMGGK